MNLILCSHVAFCLFTSIMNADLALSVTMTTVSTLLSSGFLPLNLYVYSYAGEFVDDDDVLLPLYTHCLPLT
jgi:predicted Na+-dependent transporter